MKKRILNRIYAVCLSLVTVLSIMGIVSYAAVRFNYTLPASLRYAESNGKVYVDNGMRVYYPNYAAAVYSGSTNIQEVSTTSPYSSSNTYFSTVTGQYYSDQENAELFGEKFYDLTRTSLKINGEGTSRDETEAVSSADSLVPLYYNTGNSKYYLEFPEALEATENGTIVLKSTDTVGSYFNRMTGKFYETVTGASAVSSRNDVINASNRSFNVTKEEYARIRNSLVQSQTAVNRVSKQQNVPISRIDPDEPFISGSKVWGWTAIASEITKNGEGVTLIQMSEATSIPESVISALESSGGTLELTFNNGVKWEISGYDVYNAGSINLETVYNSKNIPSSLIKKVSKGAVSTSQISIGNNNPFGLTSSVTVKLPVKRAGYDAKIYRYNDDENTLVLIDKGEINESGAVRFIDIDSGGDYVIVVV